MKTYPLDDFQESAVVEKESISEFQSIKELFLVYLAENGITQVFGLPGGAIYSIWDFVTHSTEFNCVLTQHEQSAAMMADGYARVTQKPALLLVTAGPGATNTLTGIAIAKSDEIPMLVITGNARQHQCGKGALQELHGGPRGIDIHQIMQAVVKASFQLTPENAHVVIREAITLSQTPPMGPVHINAWADVWDQKPVAEISANSCPLGPVPAVEYSNESDWRSKTEFLAQRLSSAKKPVFVVGNGVYRAQALGVFKSVVEKLGALVIETPSAHGSFFHAHPLYVGITGFGGHEIANSHLFDDPFVDLIVVVGTSGREASGLLGKKIKGPHKEVWHIHPDKTVFDLAFGSDHFIAADAHDVLGWVDKLLPNTEQIQKDLKSYPYKAFVGHEIVEKQSNSGQLLHPQQWREELGAIMPPKTLIFSDMGGHSFHNTQSLRLSQGSKMIINWNLGCMGHGLVAPMGAAVGLNESSKYEHIIAIVGDACFLMCGLEIMNSAKLGSKVTWIIENNRGHNISYHGSKAQGRVLKDILYDDHVDLAAMVSAMGVRAVKINCLKDLRQNLQLAFFNNKMMPLVLDCHVDPTVAPPIGTRMKTLVSVVLPE